MFTSEDLPPGMGYAFGVRCDADPDVDGDDLERAKVVTQITMFRELLENTLLFLFDLRFISNLTHPHNLYWYHALNHKAANDMVGTLPMELHQLQYLKELYISVNPGIVGTIPPEYGSMTRLTMLALSYNSIEGKIPHSFSGLTKLEQLKNT